MPYQLGKLMPMCIRLMWLKFKKNYRILIKIIIAATPFVRRSKFNKIKSQLISSNEKINTDYKYQQLSSFFTNLESFFAIHAYKTIIFLSEKITKELCLFVTHSPTIEIKNHVIEHISFLIKEGISVILIVNTEVNHTEIKIPEKLKEVLHGIIIRDNKGYDFAAWAHAYHEIKNKYEYDRLYLVNDSIVGPISAIDYYKIINFIRNSNTDLIGLTMNNRPIPHLQSYFLVANNGLLKSELWNSFMKNVLNLPTKEHVIDAYETKITRFFQENGFTCKSVFPIFSQEESTTNDTIYNWDKLIQAGFPFIKASILKNNKIQ